MIIYTSQIRAEVKFGDVVEEVVPLGDDLVLDLRESSRLLQVLDEDVPAGVDGALHDLGHALVAEVLLQHGQLHEGLLHRAGKDEGVKKILF